MEVSLPIPRMTWQEAMDRYGSDKPDIRFGMELRDVTEAVKDSEFAVFKGAIENGGTVRGINAKGQGGMPRKKIDKLVSFAKDFGAKGLAYIAIQEDGTVKSSFAKFMTEEEMKALIDAMEGGRTVICFSLRLTKQGCLGCAGQSAAGAGPSDGSAGQERVQIHLDHRVPSP